jgi:hypothetical protein
VRQDETSAPYCFPLKIQGRVGVTTVFLVVFGWSKQVLMKKFSVTRLPCSQTIGWNDRFCLKSHSSVLEVLHWSLYGTLPSMCGKQ